MPEVSRTRATFRRAEFGFFGVVVYTRVQTPRRCGDARRAGLFVLLRGRSRPLRTSCWMVGMALSSSALSSLCRADLGVSGEPVKKPDPPGPAPGAAQMPAPSLGSPCYLLALST